MKTYLGFLVIAILLLPAVFSIGNFVIQETEKIALRPEAEDSDNDALVIAYSYPLNKYGEWQTKYGDAGNYNVNITVSDGETSASEQVLIIVTKKEEPPLIGSFHPLKDILNINENENIDFDITASDKNNDNLSYAWYLDDSFISASDKLTYGTTYDSEGTYTISVIVSDGKFKANHSWVVNVNDIDNPPILGELPYKEINENEEVVIEISATDQDGDEIYLSSPNMPNGSVLQENIFTWKPGYDTIDVSSITGRILNNFRILSKTFTIGFVAESRNSSVETAALIKVNNVNRQPVLEDLPPVNVNEGESFYINPKAYDPDGTPLKISYSGWIDTNSHATGYEDQGIHYVKVTASDGILETSKFVQININDVNIPPLFDNIPKSSIYEGEKLILELKARDLDNDGVMFSSINPPENSTIESNIFTWMPSFDTVKKGSRIITLEFSASDGKSLINRTALVEVKNANRKPEIISIIPKNRIDVSVNTPVVFSINAQDYDDDKLLYKWDIGIFGRYEGSSVHKRIFTAKGDKKVKVTVSDGTESAEHEWNIKVR